MHNKRIGAIFTLTLLLYLLIKMNITRMRKKGKRKVMKLITYKAAVVIPYRERFDQLVTFTEHICNFLSKKEIIFDVFVINQKDPYRFNRGALINVGFLFINNKHKYDYMIVHDVDLLPLCPELNYYFPLETVFHISDYKLHPLYHYKSFFGGAFSINMKNFQKLNGMSSQYWGWGREDDDFYQRILRYNIKINRNSDFINKTGCFSHIHGPNQKRDKNKLFLNSKVLKLKSNKNGLNTTNYRILKVQKISIDSKTLTLLDTELECKDAEKMHCL